MRRRFRYSYRCEKTRRKKAIVFDFTGVEGVVFDCDGTVLDTLGAWEEAERELFAQTGPLTQEQEDRIHAAPIEEACRIMHEEYGVGNSAEEIMAHLDGYLMPYYREKAKVLPGVIELVRALEREGITFAIMSSSPRRYLEAGLGNVGLLGAFFDIITTDEIGCAKDDEKMFERAISVLDSNKEATWVIDDAPYALRAMKAWGFKTIAPLNGCSEERARQLEQVADIVVPTLEALL